MHGGPERIHRRQSSVGLAFSCFSYDNCRRARPCGQELALFRQGVETETMRLKPIEPFSFSILAILLVVVFVFQLVLLLFMASIYPAIRPPGRVHFIEVHMDVD